MATHPSYGAEVWKSDGTAGGFVLLKDINLGSLGVAPTEFIIFNDLLKKYFYSFDGSFQRNRKIRELVKLVFDLFFQIFY
jgi:ELWxxDGT repeat protein